MKDKIISSIKDKFPDAEVNIFTQDDEHFKAVIISDIFINKDIVERQKMIYDIIGSFILEKKIHAISFKTYTNNEWKENNTT
jgi:acid stress-induced BolA-like protein IbaG/YrbA